MDTRIIGQPFATAFPKLPFILDVKGRTLLPEQLRARLANLIQTVLLGRPSGNTHRMYRMSGLSKSNWKSLFGKIYKLVVITGAFVVFS